MPWATQTLAHARITGKNSTDPVTRVPKTAVALADPIPADTAMLAEARTLVEGRILAYNGTYVMDYGGPQAFLDAALANSQLTGYLLDLLAWAYLYYWNDSSWSEEGDRYFNQRNKAQEMLAFLTAPFMDIANATLEISVSETAVIKGRASSIDAWGPYD